LDLRGKLISCCFRRLSLRVFHRRLWTMRTTGLIRHTEIAHDPGIQNPLHPSHRPVAATQLVSRIQRHFLPISSHQTAHLAFFQDFVSHCTIPAFPRRTYILSTYLHCSIHDTEDRNHTVFGLAQKAAACINVWSPALSMFCFLSPSQDTALVARLHETRSLSRTQ
jgi:hypothetical protein